MSCHVRKHVMSCDMQRREKRLKKNRRQGRYALYVRAPLRGGVPKRTPKTPQKGVFQKCQSEARYARVQDLLGGPCKKDPPPLGGGWYPPKKGYPQRVRSDVTFWITRTCKNLLSHFFCTKKSCQKICCTHQKMCHVSCEVGRSKM